jgi:hypothetical protein
MEQAEEIRRVLEVPGKQFGEKSLAGECLFRRADPCP